MSGVESREVLALTTWGAETLDALQSATDTGRDEIGRRACADAISDARNLTCVQGSLFEKLLVIERFGLYRSHLVKDGETERGCESVQEFIEHAVAPVVQLHRNTLYRLRDAVWEAGRLLEKYGAVKADWSHLSLLAGETKRQLKGAGALEAEQYEVLCRQVAAGEVPRRDIEAALRRRPRQPSRSRTRERVLTGGDEPRVAPRRPASPMEELQRIAAAARTASAADPRRNQRVVERVSESADALAAGLEQLSGVPSETWRDCRPALVRVLGLLRSTMAVDLEAFDDPFADRDTEAA